MNYNGQIAEIKGLTDLDLVQFNDGLNPFGNSFIRGGFKRGVEYYRRTVESLGMSGYARVADLGAGYGRWSGFLAETNGHVTGFERNDEALKLAARLMTLFELENCDFKVADITDIPAESESFDAVWCYNTLQFVNRRQLLSEAFRILEPGGVLAVGIYNGIGKVLHKLLKGYAMGGLDHHTTQFALRCLRQGPLFDDGNGTYGSESHLQVVLDRYGFDLDTNYDIIVEEDTEVAAGINLSLDLSDPAAFATQFENDKEYATTLADQPDIVQKFPQNLNFRAIRRS